jgi:hypothetical protein
MNANFTLGMDCKLFYGAALLNGSSVLPSTPQQWTEADNAQNVTLGGSTGESDITTRASGKWKQSAATHKAATIDTEMLWKPGDAFFEAVKDAWLAGGEIAVAAMDGGIEDSGVQGLASNCVVINFTRTEQLEEAAKVAVSFKPSSFTEWYEVATGATAATGSVTLSGQPGDANLVVIGDGENTVTFEFDTANAVEAGHTRVVVGNDAPATITALINAINASVLNIGAAEDSGDKATLTHQTLGVIGNVAITKTGANIAVVGMTGGV